ncbi:MAG TPA: NUDIX hydrolase [Cellvibrionaceae bacterium]|nr:NUDIX hydrolase [Cellvibrionaceae bacterium]
MICFDTVEGRFNFRSVAVIIHSDHILIHRAVEDNFWALPGGRVEFFENSDLTVKREMIEELGLECEVVRQLWHVENFFEYNALKFHELANYFLVSFARQPLIESEIDFKGLETSVNLLFRWVPLVNLKSYNLKPEFLIDKLIDLPNSLECLKVKEINV